MVGKNKKALMLQGILLKEINKFLAILNTFEYI
jgi:hypothetical protein